MSDEQSFSRITCLNRCLFHSLEKESLNLNFTCLSYPEVTSLINTILPGNLYLQKPIQKSENRSPVCSLRFRGRRYGRCVRLAAANYSFEHSKYSCLHLYLYLCSHYCVLYFYSVCNTDASDICAINITYLLSTHTHVALADKTCGFTVLFYAVNHVVTIHRQLWLVKWILVDDRKHHRFLHSLTSMFS